MAKRNKLSWDAVIVHPDFTVGVTRLYIRLWNVWQDPDTQQLLYQQPGTENLMPLEQALAVDEAVKALNTGEWSPF